MRYSISVCLIVFGFCGKISASTNNNVILLAGYMGNQLDFTSNSFSFCKIFSNKVWLDAFELLLCPKSWLRVSKLNYSPATKKSLSEEGVAVTVPKLGSTEAMEYLSPFPQHIKITSYFKKIVKCLEKKGYKKGVDLFGAPRDWRRAPHEQKEHFANLKKLIESSYKNNRKRVVLICHSMGGNIAYLFLRKQTKAWKKKYISKLMVIGTPFGGGFKYWYGYLYDDDYPANMFPIVRQAERTYSAYSYLVPSADTWNDTVFVETPSQSYTVSELGDFFSKINNDLAYQMYLDTHKVNPEGLPHPGCDVECIGGFLEKSTPRKLIYESDDFKSKPKVVYGDGDTFVNDEALQRCQLWNDPKSKFKFAYKQFETDHLGLIRDNDPVNYICETAADSK